MTRPLVAPKSSAAEKMARGMVDQAKRRAGVRHGKIIRSVAASASEWIVNHSLALAATIDRRGSEARGRIFVCKAGGASQRCTLTFMLNAERSPITGRRVQLMATCLCDAF